MGDLFKRLWEKVKDLVVFAAKQRVSVDAAHVSFFLVLAAFPLLVLLLSILRYTGLDVNALTDLLYGFVPAALFSTIERVVLVAYRSTSGTVVSLSVVMALWSSSRGFYSLTTGLNDIYGVAERRGYWRIRAMSVLYTFLFLIVLLLTLVLNVFLPVFLEKFPVQGVVWDFVWQVLDKRHVLLFVVQTGLFTAMFMVLPNRRNRFLDSLPGALLASIGWQIFSNLYSVYVEHFTGYANIYGSVYGLALSMLWLYCCISILLYGAVLNRWLADNRK